MNSQGLNKPEIKTKEDKIKLNQDNLGDKASLVDNNRQIGMQEILDTNLQLHGNNKIPITSSVLFRKLLTGNSSSLSTNKII